MRKMSKIYPNVSERLHLDRERIFQGEIARNGADLRCRGRFLWLRSDFQARWDWPAFPAPTVPRWRSYSGGMGKRTGKGERYWELPSSVFSAPVMRGPSCQKTHPLLQPRLLPFQPPSFQRQDKTCISFVESYFERGFCSPGSQF